MFLASDFIEHFAAQPGIRAVPNGLRSVGRLSSIVLIGHSSSGKSTLLNTLERDRTRADWDKFCKAFDEPRSPETVREFVADGPNRPDLLAFGNDHALLEELSGIENRDFLVVYLERAVHFIRRTIGLVNADGFTHPPFTDELLEYWYGSFEGVYRSTADVVLSVGDAETEVIARHYEAFRTRAAGPRATRGRRWSGPRTDSAAFGR